MGGLGELSDPFLTTSEILRPSLAVSDPLWQLQQSLMAHVRINGSRSGKAQISTLLRGKGTKGNAQGRRHAHTCTVPSGFHRASSQKLLTQPNWSAIYNACSWPGLHVDLIRNSSCVSATCLRPQAASDLPQTCLRPDFWGSETGSDLILYGSEPWVSTPGSYREPWSGWSGAESGIIT